MAKFKYRMQSILNVKMKLEVQAKQEFASAQAALNREEEKLDRLAARKKAYEEEAEELLRGKLNFRDIADNRTAIHTMEDYIETQKVQVKKAEKAVDAAREKLTVVMQERKMHEKLKEHAFEEFLMEEKKQEGKEVDELTSYTYGQRIQNANRKNQSQEG